MLVVTLLHSADHPGSTPQAIRQNRRRHKQEHEPPQLRKVKRPARPEHPRECHQCEADFYQMAHELLRQDAVAAGEHRHHAPDQAEHEHAHRRAPQHPKRAGPVQDLGPERPRRQVAVRGHPVEGVHQQRGQQRREHRPHQVGQKVQADLDRGPHHVRKKQAPHRVSDTQVGVDHRPPQVAPSHAGTRRHHVGQVPQLHPRTPAARGHHRQRAPRHQRGHGQVKPAGLGRRSGSALPEHQGTHHHHEGYVAVHAVAAQPPRPARHTGS